MYIEDMLKIKSKEKEVFLKNFFKKELENKLVNNTIYEYYKERDQLIEPSDADNSFFILDFYIDIDRINLKGWYINFITPYNAENAQLDLMLECLSKDNDLKSIVIEYKELTRVVKDIISKNSSYNYVTSDEINDYLKRMELLLEVKEKLFERGQVRSYWRSIDEDLILYIPSHNAQLELKDRSVYKLSIEDFKNITLPYIKNQSNEMLLKTYFEKLDLFSLLKNAKLQQTFSKHDETYDVKRFERNLANKPAFNNLKEKNINLVEKFLKTYTEEELHEVYYSSVSKIIPASLLLSPSLKKRKPKYVDVIKTERGVFYLKEDNDSIGFQTLNEVYSN